MANINRVGEIEEEEATPLLQHIPESDPIPQRARTVTTKVPEAEVHAYKQGKGPIDVIKTGLTGWDQDQLEVCEILDKYGFKSVYAFTAGSGQTCPSGSTRGMAGRCSLTEMVPLFMLMASPSFSIEAPFAGYGYHHHHKLRQRPRTVATPLRSDSTWHQ